MNKYKAIKVNGKKVDEHRYIMENFIGRKLSFDECVHHKDGDKSNNAIDNLEIMTRADHHRLHMKERVEKGGISEETRKKCIENGRKNRPKSSLSEETALAIKTALQTKPQIEVAKEFGVSRQICYQIKNGISWNWI